MNFSSRLLYDLARGVDAVQLGGFEGVLEVPPTIVPVATIPIAHRHSTSTLPATDNQRASFSTEVSRTRAASAAAVTDEVCRFAKGLWLVDLRHTGLADFTQVITADRQFRADLRDPDGNTISLVRSFAVANVAQLGVRSGLFLFATDAWGLSMTCQATGVAQTTQHMVEVLAFLLA